MADIVCPLMLLAHWVDNGRTLGGQLLMRVVGWFSVVLTLDLVMFVLILVVLANLG